MFIGFLLKFGATAPSPHDCLHEGEESFSVLLRRDRTDFMPIIFEPLPHILHPFEKCPRSTYVDDPKIIYGVHGFVGLICRTITTFVLVEDKLAIVFWVLVRETQCRWFLEPLDQIPA